MVIEGLGKRVRLARMRQGWQQNEFCDRVQLSRKYVSQIEQNKVDPRASIIARLAKTLGVSADYLLGCKKEEYVDGLNVG